MDDSNQCDVVPAHGPVVHGCDQTHDGLVCWPQTLAGEQAKVDCLDNVAFSQAIKQSISSEGDCILWKSRYIKLKPQFSESLYTAYAYRVCSNNSVWAEKADYSECLHLITNIPMSNEVNMI